MRREVSDEQNLSSCPPMALVYPSPSPPRHAALASGVKRKGSCILRLQKCSRGSSVAEAYRKAGANSVRVITPFWFTVTLSLHRQVVPLNLITTGSPPLRVLRQLADGETAATTSLPVDGSSHADMFPQCPLTLCSA